MSTIGATQFKQECLAILDRLGPKGIVITKHGKPVAKLIPVETESSSLIGSLAGKIRVHSCPKSKTWKSPIGRFSACWA